jgi:hypothetical protein
MGEFNGEGHDRVRPCDLAAPSLPRCKYSLLARAQGWRLRWVASSIARFVTGCVRTCPRECVCVHFPWRQGAARWRCFAISTCQFKSATQKCNITYVGNPYISPACFVAVLCCSSCVQTSGSSHDNTPSLHTSFFMSDTVGMRVQLLA